MQTGCGVDSRRQRRQTGSSHTGYPGLKRSRGFIISLVSLVCAAAIPLFSVACGSGSTALLTPSPTSDLRCGLTLTPGSMTMEAGGGPGNLTITTARECSWTVSASAAWITFSSPLEGQGPAELAFVVAQNRSTDPRTLELA